MDIIFLVSIAISLIIVIIIVAWFSKKKSERVVNQDAPVREQPVRRAAGVRGVRQRRVVRPAEPEEQFQDNGDNNQAEDGSGDETIDLSKMGAKKRAKIEAKAARKAQREIEEREREERKKREQQLQEERDKQSALEREEEKRREEAEKLAREEREKREQEEYLKLKEAFSIEEEGFDEQNVDAQSNLLQEFVDYIKHSKVVLLEDLAQRFSLKTAAVIKRIQSMQADGILSGVMDDRGKFIYISQKELEDVAKFVKQRGRVSIQELVEHSNTLINLIPGNSCKIIET